MISLTLADEVFKDQLQYIPKVDARASCMPKREMDNFYKKLGGKFLSYETNFNGERVELYEYSLL